MIGIVQAVKRVRLVSHVVTVQPPESCQRSTLADREASVLIDRPEQHRNVLDDCAQRLLGALEPRRL